MGDILKGELTNLLGDAVGVVATRSNAFLLNERMDLATQETALAVGLYLDDGGIAGDSLEVHAVGRAEVAETVGNETAFVDLCGAYDMRTVPIDDVGTMVDAEMGETAQMPALLLVEGLHGVGQVAVACTFSATVEGDNDDVGMVDEVVDDATDGGQLLV